MEHLGDEEIRSLELKANEIRETIIEMLLNAGSGHTAGPLGMADIFAALYFSILRHDPKNPDWPDRDLAAIMDSFIKVPVLGAISAGPGLLAEENIEDTLTLPRNFLRYQTGEVFGLKVKGDSMIGAGILEGDLVMVRQQRTALEGEIVVALLGEEATVKYFQRRSDGIYLVSANPAYPPRKVGEDFSIMGKVVNLLRQY